MHKAISRTLWGVVFVGGLTVLGAGAANAADTSGEDGVASGNQVGILGEAPVIIDGNAISILGDSESSGTTTESTASGDSTDAAATTGGDDGVASGNQVMPDVVAPVVLDGNAVSVLGDSSTSDSTATNTVADDSGTTTPTTGGDDGIASGNQVAPDATVPVTVSGNSISVVGDSTTEGTQTSAATADEGSTDGTTTSGSDGIASGNQVAPGVDAPIVVGGNDVSVIRDDTVLEDGLLADGILGDGLLDSEFLEGGLLDDGLLADETLRERTPRMGILGTLSMVDPIAGDTLTGEPTSDDSEVSEPAFTSPVFRSFGLSAFAPLAVDVGVGDGSATSDEAAPGFTPLMATAALSPTMMLAATGAPALPLIGGIALMLGTGLALVAAKRMGHDIG